MRVQFQSPPHDTDFFVLRNSTGKSGAVGGTLDRMGEGSSKEPRPTAARFALADNVKRLMAAGPYEDAQVAAALREMGYEDFSYKTIERMKNPYHDSSPNLASIEAVARFFRLDAYKLLIPRAMVSGSEQRLEKPAIAPAKTRRISKG